LGIGRKVSNESVIKIANFAVLLGSDNHTGVGVALTGIFMSTLVRESCEAEVFVGFLLVGSPIGVLPWITCELW
jgi:hypothetical protein